MIRAALLRIVSRTLNVFVGGRIAKRDPVWFARGQEASGSDRCPKFERPTQTEPSRL